MSAEPPALHEPHRPQPGQFTLQQLLVVVCLISMTLALTTQWRHMGLVIACFLVGVALGAWQRHAGLFFACLAAVMVFLTTYAAAWVQLGNNRTMNDGDVRWDVALLHHLDSALATYEGEHGAYPQSLDAIDNSQNFCPVTAEGELANRWKHPLHYRRSGEGYELTSWGRDGKPGGIGLDEDISSQASLGAKRVTRLPFGHFAFDTNGSPGVFMAALFGSLVTAHATWSLPKQFPSRNLLIATAITITAAASVVAFFLAALYIAAGNSGH